MDQTARSTALAISEPNRWPRTKKPTRRPAFLMNMSWSGRQDSNRPAVRTMRRGSDAAPAACDLTAQSTIQNKKASPKASFSIKTIGRGDRIRIGLPYEQSAEVAMPRPQLAISPLNRLFKTKKPAKRPAFRSKQLVGETGFEPATSTSRT